MRTLAALIITALSTGLAVGEEAPPIKPQVLQSKRINLRDHALILNRVVPSILPPAPAPAAVAAKAQNTKSEVDEDRREQKKQEMLFLSATVYDRQVTEVRCFAGQREIRIFTNIDFNLLNGLRVVETDDTVYSLLFGLGNETRGDIEVFNEQEAKEGLPERSAKRIPAAESFSKTRSEYMMVDGDTSKVPPEEFVKALDALHTFFDANRQQLTENYAKREAARIEQERWLKEHPPTPKDTVINYWVGDGATRILDKRSMGERP